MTRPPKVLSRNFIPILVFLALSQLGFSQTSLKDIELNYGPYPVGFTHKEISDPSRTYQKIYDYSTERMARPIAVSVWYPAREGTSASEPLRVLDYFRILKEEEEWEHLPDEQLLKWFYYQNTPSNQSHLMEDTKAFSAPVFANGSFPVILYAPSFQATSVENFALCEYLASHGYLVISSPSRGSETRWFVKAEKEMETQARDLEFLIAEALQYPLADTSTMAAMGFSFGSLAGVLVQMRNDRIKAFVSLDGTERYQESILKASPFFDYGQLDVPYMHMAQKNIPDSVLKADDIPPEVNTTFTLYDSITKSRAYRLKFHNLTHSCFSTMGVLFEKRDPRQDKSDPQIMESYRWVSIYAKMFFDAFLKGDVPALEFVNNAPVENGVPRGLISNTSKLPQTEPMGIEEFNDLAVRQHYEKLNTLYNSLLVKNPDLILPENNLNTLGLQLVFNPEKGAEGIRVLRFATELYPQSANLMDSLAEAYLFLGEEEKALECFKKSLELNPQNQNAVQRIKELKG